MMPQTKEAKKIKERISTHSAAHTNPPQQTQRHVPNRCSPNRNKPVPLHIAFPHGAGFRPPGLTSQALRCSISLAASRAWHQEPK